LGETAFADRVGDGFLDPGRPRIRSLLYAQRRRRAHRPAFGGQDAQPEAAVRDTLLDEQFLSFQPEEVTTPLGQPVARLHWSVDTFDALDVRHPQWHIAGGRRRTPTLVESG
jgi:hypothetical protein